MLNRMGRYGVAVVLMGALSGAALATTLEEVQKKVQGAWEKHKSVAAKMTIEQKMDMGGGSMESKGGGTIETQRKDGKLLARLEMKSTMTQKFGENSSTMEQQMLSISDGEFTWVLSEMMGQKQAFKSKPDGKMYGDPEAMFTELGKEHELRLAADQDVSGRKAYVIEAVPKDKGANPMLGKMELCFDQDWGIMVKMVVYNPDAKPIQTVTYSDVKIDEPIPAERFVWKTPEGVEVMDHTGGPATAPAPAKEPAKEPAKDTPKEPAKDQPKDEPKEPGKEPKKDLPKIPGVGDKKP